jgi:hypothetical protein
MLKKKKIFLDLLRIYRGYQYNPEKSFGAKIIKIVAELCDVTVAWGGGGAPAPAAARAVIKVEVDIKENKLIYIR